MGNHKYAKALLSLSVTASISTLTVLMGAAPTGAPSSGGGGHASAPAAAPTAHAAAPAAAPHVTNSAAPAAPARSTNSNQTAAVHASNTNNARPQAALAHQHVDRDQHYQTVYGNPWWPNATGWNSGWYGNGYGNSGYYNDPSYGSTPTNNAPTQNTDVASPSADPSLDANRPTAAAQADNAVHNSPVVTSLNDNIQHAQSEFDIDRQRVLLDLKNNPDYQKAVASRKNASQSLKSTTQPAVNGAPALAMMDAATAKLNAADDVTKMEEQAIAADPKAAADKERLAELVSQRDAQEAQIRGH